MKYMLMHKHIAVAELVLDDETGFIQKIVKTYNIEHLPVGISYKKRIVDRAELNAWWTDRSIPASRSGIREALDTLNLSNTKMLLVRCFGLSLSDQYWIKPSDSDITWDKVNFFNNNFSDDIGDVLFGGAKKENDFDFSSPDNTSDGCLKKRWKIINGKRCLIKGGSNPYRQQPFNEVIASKIMNLLGIDHIQYNLTWDNGSPYSVCEDFVTGETELVSAWRIMQTQKKDNQTSVYQHFVNCCKDLGVKDIESSLDKMIVLDFIIANEDRHLNNFGLIRNAETLEWIGFAPIFDSGSSLGYENQDSQIGNKNITCKPFKKTHEEQLKLVKDFSFIDFNKLELVENIISSVFAEDNNNEWISQARVKAIQDLVNKRISTLQDIAQTHFETQDNIKEDVEENVSATYTLK